MEHLFSSFQMCFSIGFRHAFFPNIIMSHYVAFSIQCRRHLFCKGSCLIYVICVCLCIVVSNTYCVEFFIWPSSCVLGVLYCQFLWVVHFWLLLRYSLTFKLFTKFRLEYLCHKTIFIIVIGKRYH